MAAASPLQSGPLAPPRVGPALASVAPPQVGDVAAIGPAAAPGVRRWPSLRGVPSWLTSAVVHFVVLITLALWTIEPRPGSGVLVITSPVGEQVERIDDLAHEQLDVTVDAEALSDDASDLVQQMTSELSAAADAPALGFETAESAAPQVELSNFGEETAPRSDLLATVGMAAAGPPLAGRGEKSQADLVRKYGGTDASQAAVAAALEWFAAHQQQDGGWNFDHRLGACDGRCANPGAVADCRTGATALALLPFLGAGQTHQQGAYQENIEKGLYFLTNQMNISKKGSLKLGDLTQGSTTDRGYSHPLAAIALCEAYAMTQDPKLREPAQLALNYIAWSQDPVGGGWRYVPRAPGDTSVLGWQLMALKSGHMGYLQVDPKTIQGATRFLDSVQGRGGATYGYTGPGMGQGTTAVGLLCRMYLGWKQDHPALREGVLYLNSRGPSDINMYYNYYATQVMRHYAGDPDSADHAMWVRWNTKLRDWLVATQEKNGHPKGSWFQPADEGSRFGGRLYCTSLATMILEVYYRHMPLYSKQAATDDFPL